MARSRQIAEKLKKTWAESAGAGDRDGAFLGLSGTAGATVALAGVSLLMILCPAVVIYVCVPCLLMQVCETVMLLHVRYSQHQQFRTQSLECTVYILQETVHKETVHAVCDHQSECAGT
jgi:Flp pilus assembly protein TadB